MSDSIELKELSFEEMEEVSGGIPWLLALIRGATPGWRSSNVGWAARIMYDPRKDPQNWA